MEGQNLLEKFKESKNVRSTLSFPPSCSEGHIHGFNSTLLTY